MSLSASKSQNILSVFDGRTLGHIEICGPMEVVRALGLAKKALEAAEASSLAERAHLLNSFAQVLSENEQDFAAILAETEGFPKSFMLEKAVRASAQWLREVASQLAQAQGTAAEQIGSPTGVISIFPAGSLSLRTLMERLAPALGAGNVVLIKVPSKAPGLALVLQKLLQLVETPPGFIGVLFGRGEEIGSLLASHPSIRGVSFVGSPKVATQVMNAAVTSGKKIQISAGAKNSLCLLPESDLGQLPRWIESVLLGQGSLGWSASRIFVTEAQATEFWPALEGALSSLKPLTSIEGNSPWTPPRAGTNEQHARWLQMAREEKAKILSAAGEESASAPIFLRDLSHCSVLQQEEIGAPICIVDVVKYAHEMAKWSNTGDYGLCAQVWGPDDKARRLAQKLQVGRVWINDWMADATPFAGWKRSFFGLPDFRWNGSFFSNQKSVI